MHKVFIALGTNMGNKLDNLKLALRILQNAEVDIIKVSRVYETTPMYVQDQPRFFNMVAMAKVSLSPTDLLKVLQTVEKTVGRKKTFRNGPRVIDLDILYIGDCILDSKDLHVPHPRLYERQFVLQPLMDIAPDWLDVRKQKTIREISHSIQQDKTIKPVHTIEKLGMKAENH